MGLLNNVLECKEEEVHSIVEEAINTYNNSAVNIDGLGFTENGKSNSIYKGFIPLSTRIKFENLSLVDYGMESTDYFYEFADFIRKYKINSGNSLVFNLEYFINNYFGMFVGASREDIFYSACETAKTDDEFFEALNNSKLGDLKGKGAAQCTERGALAQQILSFYGMETYYCIGCVDLGNRQEAHCFNVVRRKNDYALLDYSVPIASYSPNGSIRGYYPFVGTLTNNEFLDFIESGTIKTFDDYYMKGNEKEITGNKRTYVIGQYTIQKEDITENVR